MTGHRMGHCERCQSLQLLPFLLGASLFLSFVGAPGSRTTSPGCDRTLRCNFDYPTDMCGFTGSHGLESNRWIRQNDLLQKPYVNNYLIYTVKGSQDNSNTVDLTSPLLCDATNVTVTFNRVLSRRGCLLHVITQCQGQGRDIDNHSLRYDYAFREEWHPSNLTLRACSDSDTVVIFRAIIPNFSNETFVALDDISIQLSPSTTRTTKLTTTSPTSEQPPLPTTTKTTMKSTSVAATTPQPTTTTSATKEQKTKSKETATPTPTTTTPTTPKPPTPKSTVPTPKPTKPKSTILASNITIPKPTKPTLKPTTAKVTTTKLTTAKLTTTTTTTKLTTTTTTPKLTTPKLTISTSKPTTPKPMIPKPTPTKPTIPTPTPTTTAPKPTTSEPTTSSPNTSTTTTQTGAGEASRAEKGGSGSSSSRTTYIIVGVVLGAIVLIVLINLIIMVLIKLFGRRFNPTVGCKTDMDDMFELNNDKEEHDNAPDSWK
ncbi:uncharacterized protein LOC143297228 [Babylonia areolata]|uniref:uncharacterized protein LOC143297228 n=1 Tax=Babylonia areolata TaxID=304850 RepID=UPI003FD1451F